MGLRQRLRGLLGSAAPGSAVHLSPVSTRPVSPHYDGVNAFGVVRNEIELLPHWLNHYRELGVGRFFVVDNGSTDGSFEYLKKESDVHLYQSTDSFQTAQFGSKWAEALASQHGSDQWWVFADIDELLVYPQCEEASLLDLTRFLDSDGARAFFAVLVDMYANKPLAEARINPKGNLLSDFPYFDAHNIISNAATGYSPSGTHYNGGVRGRVFGLSVCLNKVPLIRYRKGDKLYGGWHFTDITPVSTVTGAVLHFKFTNRFLQSVAQEVSRKEHWLGGGEYVRYQEFLKGNPNPNLYDERSTRLQSSETLVNARLMRSNEIWQRWSAAGQTLRTASK